MERWDLCGLIILIHSDMSDILIQLLKPVVPSYAFSWPDGCLEKNLGKNPPPPIGPLSVSKANYSSRPSAVKPPKTPLSAPVEKEPQSTTSFESLRQTHTSCVRD